MAQKNRTSLCAVIPRMCFEMSSKLSIAGHLS